MCIRDRATINIATDTVNNNERDIYIYTFEYREQYEQYEQTNQNGVNFSLQFDHNKKKTKKQQQQKTRYQGVKKTIKKRHTSYKKKQAIG